MALFFVFLLGVANFAGHRAVLESGHPLLAEVGWVFRSLAGRMSLAAEFLLLLGTMLLVAGGSSGWAVGYGLYSMLTAVSVWLVLSRRV